MKCNVCTNVVGEAHQCKLCKNKVHLTSGDPEGDEDYGQSVVRFTCSKIRRVFLNVFCFFVKTFE